MATHESGCTANPKRICNVCNEVGTTPMPELLAIIDGIKNENKDAIVGLLSEKANGCPACILAALRQHPKTKIKGCELEDINGLVFTKFDAKSAWDKWKKAEMELQREYRFGG